MSKTKELKKRHGAKKENRSYVSFGTRLSLASGSLLSAPRISLPLATRPVQHPSELRRKSEMPTETHLEALHGLRRQAIQRLGVMHALRVAAVARDGAHLPTNPPPVRGE